MEDSRDHKHQYFLAAVPIVAYFCMLTYEAGRYSYLQIPFSYVELSTQRIAQIGATTLLVVLALFMLLTYVIGLAESKSEGRSIAARAVLYGVLIVPLALSASASWGNLLMAVGISLFYATTPPASSSDSDEKEQKSLVQRRLGSLRSNTGGAIFLSLVCFFTFFKAGHVVQQLSSSHIVDAARPNRIIVGVFNGTLLVKTFDPATRKFLDGFELQPIDAPLRLRTSEVATVAE